MNNIGCALLGRKCHPQAHSTFHDALQLVELQHTVERQSAVDADVERVLAMRLQDFNSKLRKAERHLSNPEPSSFLLPHETLPFHMSSPSLSVAFTATESGDYHTLRIDACDVDPEGDGIVTLDVLSCILMLNLAISSLGVIKGGMMRRGGAAFSVNLDCALRFLVLASRLTEQFDYTSYQGLFLTIVSLDSTVRVLLEAGEVNAAQAAQLRLTEVMDFVEANFSHLLAEHPAAMAA
jgi:hypothetical protein